MSKRALWIGLVAVIVLVLVGGYYIAKSKQAPAPTAIGGQKDAQGCLTGAGYSWCEAKKTCLRQWEEYCTTVTPKTVVFTCDGGNQISATFYTTDDKFVDLNMSDGRKMSVPRAISASGARYANASESFVFWNKGDTAFVQENGVTTISNCVLK